MNVFFDFVYDYWCGVCDLNKNKVNFCVFWGFNWMIMDVIVL